MNVKIPVRLYSADSKRLVFASLSDRSEFLRRANKLGDEITYAETVVNCKDPALAQYFSNVGEDEEIVLTITRRAKPKPRKSKKVEQLGT